MHLPWCVLRKATLWLEGRAGLVERFTSFLDGRTGV